MSTEAGRQAKADAEPLLNVVSGGSVGLRVEPTANDKDPRSQADTVSLSKARYVVTNVEVVQCCQRRPPLELKPRTRGRARLR